MLEKSVNKKFTLKNTFIDSREKIVFQELDSAEKNAVISKNNNYGRVVCRCETVTEGEIRAAAQSPISPVSVDGIKRQMQCWNGTLSRRFLWTESRRDFSRRTKQITFGYSARP